MSGARARLAQLTVGGHREPWRQLGIDFDDQARCRIGQVSLHVDESRPSGFFGWAFDPVVPSLDGIESVPLMSFGQIDADDYTCVDHVVVMTDSLERTSREIEDRTGAGLRRIREAGGGVRQAFHRSDEVVLEVVHAPTITDVSLWGFVLVAPDLANLAKRLGPEVIGDPKEATQPERLIATVRREVGLGVRVALITPTQ